MWDDIEKIAETPVKQQKRIDHPFELVKDLAQPNDKVARHFASLGDRGAVRSCPRCSPQRRR